MAAPELESLTSISPSSRTDGLGRRELLFDRETGEMLERLHACPQVDAFETVIRERIERLADFNDARFVQVRAVERVDETLTVLSTFVPGQTLADLFDAARDLSLVPGLDAALGYLVEALSAVASLHDATGCAHGLIAPERTIFTLDGGLVFLDSPYATVVERLALPRQRQWDDFGIGGRPVAAAENLEPLDDVSQVAISTVMLILGRRLDFEDVEQLPALMADVAEVALIRGSVAFAQGLQALLERLLLLPGHVPYASADEAIVDLRALLAREIGLEACRAALVDFIAQCNPTSDDASDGAALAADVSEVEAPPQELAAWPEEEAASPTDPDLDLTEDSEPAEAAPAEDAPVEFEISLDEGESPRRRSSPRAVSLNDDEDDEDDAQLFDFSSFDLSKNIGAFTPNVLRRIEPPVDLTPPPPPIDELDAAALAAPAFIADAFTFAPAPDTAATGTAYGEVTPRTDSDTPQPVAAPFSGLTSHDPSIAESADGAGNGRGPSTFDWPATASDRPIQLVAGVKAPESVLFGRGPAEAPAYGEVVPTAIVSEGSSAAETGAPAGQRRKRHKKSDKTEKDKLRSVAKPDLASGETPAWLVPPEKQAKFDQITPEPTLSPVRPAVVQTPAAPPVPLPFAAPVPPVTINRAPLIPLAPVVAAPPPPTAPLPQFDLPPVIKPIAAPASTMSIIIPDDVFAPVKIKADLPTGYSPAVKAAKAAERARQNRHVVEELPESLPLPEAADEAVAAAPPRNIPLPLKLAAALVVLVVIGVVAGRASLPGGALGKAAAQTDLPAADEPEEQPEGTVITGNGQVVVNTEPTGARVTLDGRPVGVSPLTLDGIAAGSHVLAVSAPSGTVKRTIRVVADHSITVDVPIFSGWVAVFAPFVVTVAEGSTTLGTTEQGRLLVAPGSHTLVMSNEALGFSTAQKVEVKAGEVAAIHLDPKGQVNINALPWAEVWWDGRKIGETPIANYSLPLGTQEFVFKNPQLGERRATATIRASEQAAVSLDFSKSPQP